MRIFFFVLMISLSLSVVAQRKQQLINFEWKHHFGDVANVHQYDLDDSKWNTVDLPHDASIAGPFFENQHNADAKNGFRPRRKGWYRKKISIDEIAPETKTFLEFEGVYRDAKVFVNGILIAEQLNGFEGFLADATNAIRRGENIITVGYDNTDTESSRWYNGEGIYRNVWLITTPRVHVAYNGTYAHTSFVTEQQAKLNIETEVINETTNKIPVTVKTIISSPDGKDFSQIIDIVPINAGETYIFKQNTIIENPKLWDIDTPNIYTAKTIVTTESGQTDTYETNFGVRTIEFCRQKGLLLNGKKVFAKGVNIHHDLGPLGAAAFERGFERRLENLKNLGCNAIRLSHNPHDKSILDWCDRNGMLVFDEAFDKWDNQFFGQNNNFDVLWRASLEAFIKRDRNHPSVFIWSVGNETTQQRSADAGYGINQLKLMVDFVHQLEPTRKVTCGLHPSRANGKHGTPDYYSAGPPEMVFYMDVVSTNYREEFWPVDRDKYPQLICILSEAQVGNLGNEWFNLNHDTSVGMFYWGGTDYIGESFGWPAKGWANGIVDWNDQPKTFSYYIQSLYSQKPMVHIAISDKNESTTKYWNEVKLRYQPMFSHWNWDGKDSLTIMTFSNCQEVELFLNGKSLGVKKIPEQYFSKDIKAHTAAQFDPKNPPLLGPEMHKKLQWRIPYQSGTLKAVAKINNKVVANHEIVTAGKPETIRLKADRDVIWANGLDLSYITVVVTDKNGVVVPNADNNIQFSVTGQGRNIAVSNADISSDEPFVGSERKLFGGKALLVVRATQQPGIIKITAKSKGLKSNTITIETIQPKAKKQ